MAYQENDYKTQYKSLKRKLKILIYENECFQEELKKAQRSLLKVQRDKTFLLDRILQYQQGPESSSDSEQTDDSDNETYSKDNNKRKKVSSDQSNLLNTNTQMNHKNSNVKKKKSSQNVLGSGVVHSKNINASRHSGKQVPSSLSSQTHAQTSSFSKGSSSSSHHKLRASLASSNSGVGACAPSATSTATSEGQMTREEIERQLAARQPFSDFSTAVSLTLPNQLFSDNITEGDLLENDLETSPSNLGEDITFENFD